MSISVKNISISIDGIKSNEFDIELVEQPVPYYDIAGLEYVKK